MGSRRLPHEPCCSMTSNNLLEMNTRCLYCLGHSYIWVMFHSVGNALWSRCLSWFWGSILLGWGIGHGHTQADKLGKAPKYNNTPLGYVHCDIICVYILGWCSPRCLPPLLKRLHTSTCVFHHQYGILFHVLTIKIKTPCSSLLTVTVLSILPLTVSIPL
jgi:hypothetical protein